MITCCWVNWKRDCKSWFYALFDSFLLAFCLFAGKRANNDSSTELWHKLSAAPVLMISLQAAIHVKTELSFICHFQSGFSSFQCSHFQLCLFTATCAVYLHALTSSQCLWNSLNLKPPALEATILWEIVSAHAEVWESWDLFSSGRRCCWNSLFV